MVRQRKRSRKEMRAIKAKAKRPYKVGTITDGKDVPNFLAGDHANAIGGTRPLLGGDSAVSEGRDPVAKGKSPILRRRRLLKGASE